MKVTAPPASDGLGPKSFNVVVVLFRMLVKAKIAEGHIDVDSAFRVAKEQNAGFSRKRKGSSVPRNKSECATGVHEIGPAAFW